MSMQHHDEIASMSESSTGSDGANLPFLITHWLSNFKPGQEDGGDARGISRVHKAAAELASAFRDLGAYGQALNVRR